MFHISVYVLLVCLISIRADDFTSTRDIEVAIRKEIYVNRKGYVTPERVENDGVQYWMSDLFYEPKEGKTLTCRFNPKKDSPLYGLVVDANVHGMGRGKGRSKGNDRMLVDVHVDAGVHMLVDVRKEDFSKGSRRHHRGHSGSKGSKGYIPRCELIFNHTGCFGMRFEAARKGKGTIGRPVTKGSSKGRSGNYADPSTDWGDDAQADFIAVCTTLNHPIEQFCFGKDTEHESLYFRANGRWIDLRSFNILVDAREEDFSKGSRRHHRGHSFSKGSKRYSSKGSKGYNSKGYSSKGYNSKGYNPKGYNSKGYISKGYNPKGYNSKGYNSKGYNFKGYNSKGYHGDSLNPFENFGIDAQGFRITDDPRSELERHIFGRGSRSETTYYRSKGKWISRERYIRYSGMSEEEFEREVSGRAMQQWKLRGNDHRCQRMAEQGRLLDLVVTFGCDGATQQCCGLRCCPRKRAMNSNGPSSFSESHDDDDEESDVCRSELVTLEKQKLRREIELLDEKKQLVQLEKRKVGE